MGSRTAPVWRGAARAIYRWPVLASPTLATIGRPPRTTVWAERSGPSGPSVKEAFLVPSSFKSTAWGTDVSAENHAASAARRPDFGPVDSVADSHADGGGPKASDAAA